MNAFPLIAKSLKYTLCVACITLLLPGCSRETPDRQPETPGQTSAPADSSTPEVLPDTLKISKRQEKSYVITGIGLKGTKRLAIINNEVVKPGEEIDIGVVLEDVQPTYAVIRVGNTKHLLRPEDIQRELDKKKQKEMDEPQDT